MCSCCVVDVCLLTSCVHVFVPQCGAWLSFGPGLVGSNGVGRGRLWTGDVELVYQVKWLSFLH